MGARPYYKRYPSDFITGCIKLSLEEKGAYSMVIDMIFDEGGAIENDPQWIARVCSCSFCITRLSAHSPFDLLKSRAPCPE